MEKTSLSEVKTELRSWILIFVLAALFVAWGMFIFFTVGDKGPPSWNFGVVRDIPGESPYSTHRAVRGTGDAPQPQHILEKPSLPEGKWKREKP